MAAYISSVIRNNTSLLMYKIQCLYMRHIVYKYSLSPDLGGAEQVYQVRMDVDVVPVADCGDGAMWVNILEPLQKPILSVVHDMSQICTTTHVGTWDFPDHTQRSTLGPVFQRVPPAAIYLPKTPPDNTTQNTTTSVMPTKSHPPNIHRLMVTSTPDTRTQPFVPRFVSMTPSTTTRSQEELNGASMSV